MTRRLQRRRFLQTSAAAGFFLTSGYELSAKQDNSPNNKLNVALIGAGGRASANLGGVSGENIVALCDVDDRRAAGAYNKYPNVNKYTDFRVMLEKQKDIDAVVVSTPDHTHAVASIMAMKLGKHCYCEKPLTHSVYEARQMRETAAKMKVATQMGNQGTSDSGLRTGVEVIRSGAIGDVREVHAWTNRPIWPQNRDRPAGEQEVPKGLNWDLWIGPAPMRPFNSAYVPFAWRGWWDFGTGALGDMGCHTMNLPFMALRLGAPTSVEADLATKLHPESGPEGCTVTYEFPARGNLPPVRFYWYERRKPDDKLLHGIKPSASGCILVGSKGSLYSSSDYGGTYKLLPEGEFANFREPERTLPRSPGHYQEWIRACKGGTPAMGNFVDYSGQLTETVLLGNVAIRSGQKILWDSEKLICLNNSPGNQYIRREYRKGWSL